VGVCYDKIKINNRYLTKNKVIDQLSLTNFSLRYSHGLSTKSELRNFLTKVGDHPCTMPNESQIDNLFKDLVSQGLVKMSYQSNLDAIQMFKKIENFYQSKNIEDLNLVRNEPILWGIRNHLVHSIEEINCEENLFNIINNISFLKVDNIVNEFRNKSKRISDINTLMTEALAAFKRYEDPMYGSSFLESTSSTSGIAQLLTNSYVATINQITDILSGQYIVPPKAPVDPWAAYAAKFS